MFQSHHYFCLIPYTSRMSEVSFLPCEACNDCFTPFCLTLSYPSTDEQFPLCGLDFILVNNCVGAEGDLFKAFTQVPLSLVERLLPFLENVRRSLQK